MKKLVPRLLFVSLITTFSSSKMVLSMDPCKYSNSKKSEGTRIPTGYEVARVTLPLKNLVKKSVDNDTKSIEDKINNGLDITKGEWKLDIAQAENTHKLENELHDIKGENKNTGCFPAWMLNQKQIELINYVNGCAETCEKENPVGVCRNWASKLWKDLNSKGIYCGLMFFSKPSGWPSMYPDHVVVIYAIKNKNDKLEYYIADPRLLQSAYNGTFLLQNGMQNYNGIEKSKIELSDFSDAWKYHINNLKDLRDIPNFNFLNPYKFLKIPLDDYLNWLGTWKSPSFLKFNPPPVSIATSPNDSLNINEKKIGPKAVEDFKNGAKEINGKIK